MSGTRRALVVALAIAVLAWLGWRWTQRQETPARRAVAAADSVSSGLKAARLFFASADSDSLV